MWGEEKMDSRNDSVGVGGGVSWEGQENDWAWAWALVWTGL